jgi:hypothetical protein
MHSCRLRGPQITTGNSRRENQAHVFFRLTNFLLRKHGVYWRRNCIEIIHGKNLKPCLYTQWITTLIPFTVDLQVPSCLYVLRYKDYETKRWCMGFATLCRCIIGKVVFSLNTTVAHEGIAPAFCRAGPAYNSLLNPRPEWSRAAAMSTGHYHINCKGGRQSAP